MEDLNRQKLDKQAVERYAKEYNKEAWKFIFAGIGKIICNLWIFIDCIRSIIYWFKNDQLTGIQFTKYFFSTYWFLIIIFIISLILHHYCESNNQALGNYKRKLDKMRSDYKQKYEVTE